MSAIQRVIDEMPRRGYTNKTIKEYSGSLRRLAAYFSCCPSKLTLEQVREYQLHLAKRHDISTAYYNSTVTALRFLYLETLQRDWSIERLPHGRRNHPLPVVLSRQEVFQLWRPLRQLKRRILLMTAYSAALRTAELVHLRVEDLDDQQQRIASCRQRRQLLAIPWWRWFRMMVGSHPLRPNRSGIPRCDTKAGVYSGDSRMVRMEGNTMMRAMICTALCVSIALTAAAEDYTTVKNVTYRTEAEANVDAYVKERCVLDVYHPDTEGFATLVFLHGGGLVRGNKKIPEEFQGAGIAVVAPNYRLNPKVHAPVYIEDAAAAVAWVFTHIKEYGGDPDKIFVSGHSSGAYLAAMVGLDKRYLEAHGIDANRIAGLMISSSQASTFFRVKMERGIDPRQPIVDDLAPLFHARADAPPLLLMTGDRELEILGHYEENALLARVMKDMGHQDCRLLEFDGYGHGITIPGFPMMLKEIERVLGAEDK